MYWDDKVLFQNSLFSLYLITLPTFLSLQFLTAPYGKHLRTGWGPTLPPPLAWFLMESPTLWLTITLFPFGRHHKNPKSILTISLFLIHYIHRTVIYPIRLARRKTSGSFPASIAFTAFAFNILNTYVQAWGVSEYNENYGDARFWWRFCGGVVVFVGGMWVNVWADGVLVGLKNEGKGYKIPKGGLFEFVSCPNYLGEIVEWLGWSIMTWSSGGFGFFMYTCANLVPRARANHVWYLEKFGEDYPKTRKAVIPFLY